MIRAKQTALEEVDENDSEYVASDDSPAILGYSSVAPKSHYILFQTKLKQVAD
jgi:hypothetical protein